MKLNEWKIGNWICIVFAKMLPHRHARCHIAYARSALLYRQTMDDIKPNMNPAEDTKLTRNGLFTIRRSDKSWASTWSDITIEQVLMHTMKTSGELTRVEVLGRSLARWIGSMPSCVEVSQAIEQYCDVRTVTSEQFVEMRDSPQSRDADDVKKLVSCLNFRSTYSQQTTQLISPSIDINDEDDTNC